MHNTQSGDAVHLGTNTPHLVPSLQCPGAFMEDPGESGGVPMVENSAPAPLADPDSAKSALMAETADAEALQPHTFNSGTEDIVPVDVATLSLSIETTSSVSTKLIPCNTVKPLAAPVPPLTDPAPASAAVCIITCNVPYCKAIDTFNWATLAMRPDTILSDVNGSMATIRCATSAHTFCINNSAIYWPSGQQENVFSTTPENDNVTAMYSSKEVPQSCSPDSDTFGDPKPLDLSLSDNHPPLTFTCDCQYHPLDHAYQHAAQLDPTGPRPTDVTMADPPNNPLSSAKGQHFVISLGLRAK